MNSDKVQARSILSDYRDGKYEDRTEELIGHAFSATGERGLLVPITNKNINFLAQFALTCLQSLAEDSGPHLKHDGSVSNFEEEEVTTLAKYQKGTTEKYDKGGPTQDSGAVVADYYERLGLSKDANDSEIKSAHKRLLQEFHPDVLTSQGKSPEEIKIAEEKAKDINEAYYYLSKPDRRAEYDKIWNERYSKNTQKNQEGKKSVPLLGNSDEEPSQYVAVSFVPSVEKKPSKEAAVQTQNFQKIVMEQGAAGVNPFFVSELKLAGLLPEGFSESQLVNAVEMYSRGVTSEDLLTATENTSFLSPEEKIQMGNTALFIEYMENSNVSGVPGPAIIGEGTGQPSFLMAQSENPATPGSGGFSFKRDAEGGLNFMFDKAGGFIKDKAGNLFKKEGEKIAAKTVVGKALKEGGKKVLKEGSKVLAKAGIKIGEKLGLSAFFESLNAIAPGLGTALDLLINWIGPILIGAVKAFLKAFSDPESLAKILALLAVGIAAGFGMMGPALAAGGLSAYAFSKSPRGSSLIKNAGGVVGLFTATVIAIASAVTLSLAWPLIVALIIIPLTLAANLFIITSGAYMVPPTPTHFTPGSIENPYIGVSKTVKSVNAAKCVSGDNTSTYLKCSNQDLNFTVEYTITITAKISPLSNVVINERCSIEKEGSAPSGCLAPNPAIPTTCPGGTVSPAAPCTFTYTRDFQSPSHVDSLASDVISVSADAVDKPAQTGTGMASVCIGDCPQNCPSIWPTDTGYVTQGPDGSWSHSSPTVEAIDIGTGTSGNAVYATHAGIVQWVDDNCEGNIIYISSTCNGTPFTSHYSHLGSREVANGSSVVKGQVIGRLDNTGSCTTADHLHYEFDGILMEPPNIPEALDPGRACCTNCNPGDRACLNDIP